MSPRPRKRYNKLLPPNLYAQKKGSTIYYSYRHPETGKFTGFGTDKKLAIDTASELNSILLKDKSLKDRVLSGKTILFKSWADKYLEIRKSEDLAESTLRTLKSNLKKSKAALGDLPLNEIGVFEIANLLDFYTESDKARSAQQLRSMLMRCFDVAISKGLIEDNPASKTMPVKVVKKRQRMKIEEFNEIIPLCNEDIRDTALIGLHTLQRREDIANFQFSDYDFENRIWKVVQEKTKTPLAIHCNDVVHNIILERYKRPILPKKNVIFHSKRVKGCRVGDAYHKDSITRLFTNAAIKSKVYEKLTDEERPTFHEIRSLGIHLYEDQGVDAQHLAGHSERKTTEHYLKGHEPEFEFVEANLVLSDKC